MLVAIHQVCQCVAAGRGSHAGRVRASAPRPRPPPRSPPSPDNPARAPLPLLAVCAVLVGHGHRALGALIVPDVEALPPGLGAEGVAALLRGEVSQLLAGRIRWEHVAAIRVLERPFSIEDGTLTRTMKVRRAEVLAAYADDVRQLEAQLR